MELPEWMMQDMASMGINLPPIPGTPDPPIPGTPPISQRSSQALTLMLGDGEPPSSQSIAEATELEETLSGLVGEDADAQYGEDDFFARLGRVSPRVEGGLYLSRLGMITPTSKRGGARCLLAR